MGMQTKPFNKTAFFVSGRADDFIAFAQCFNADELEEFDSIALVIDAAISELECGDEGSDTDQLRPIITDSLIDSILSEFVQLPDNLKNCTELQLRAWLEQRAGSEIFVANFV